MLSGMPELVVLTLAPIAAYLVGAIPFALLVGRSVGIDLLTQGSRNPGAGNLTRLAGLRYGVAAAVADGLKGLLPVLLARRAGLPAEVAAVTGIAAVVGHNWSVYLGGRAGRGLATAVGVAVGVAPMLLIWTTLWAVVGWKMGGGLGGFVGWGVLPAYAITAGQPLIVVMVAVSLASIILVRRAQGSPGDARGWRNMVSRVVWDTDTRPSALEAENAVAS